MTENTERTEETEEKTRKGWKRTCSRKHGQNEQISSGRHLACVYVAALCLATAVLCFSPFVFDEDNLIEGASVSEKLNDYWLVAHNEVGKSTTDYTITVQCCMS